MAPTDRRRLCKFRLNWLAYDDFWAWLTPVKTEQHKAFCNLCKKVFNIGHGGVNDVKAHAKLKGHSELREQQQQTRCGNNFKFGGCANTTNVIYNPEVQYKFRKSVQVFSTQNLHDPFNNYLIFHISNFLKN